MGNLKQKVEGDPEMNYMKKTETRVLVWSMKNWEMARKQTNS